MKLTKNALDLLVKDSAAKDRAIEELRVTLADEQRKVQDLRLAQPKSGFVSVDLAKEAVTFMPRNMKIDRVKLLRNLTGLGLREAKNVVEEMTRLGF